ncbi:MAG: hypothetical protein JWQ38_2133 [Flavipsychrobacter sp.]|nr:hypothetical protein [Flavipsychrobacter sp.]
MRKKSFKITFELEEGYADPAPEHSLNFAEEVIKEWMEARILNKRPIVTGLLQNGSLFYPVKSEQGNTKVRIARSAIYFGELSAPDDMLRKKPEIKNTLESLALTIKNKLNQQTVYIIYKKENWHV